MPEIFYLFLSSRVSYFSSSAFPFEAVPFSSFLSWPRSDTGESVSVTVLETSFRFVKEIFFLLVSLFLDGPSTRNPSYGLTSWPQILHHHRSLELTFKSRDLVTHVIRLSTSKATICHATNVRHFPPVLWGEENKLPIAQLKGVKLLGITICAVLSVLLRLLPQVFLQRKCLGHRSGKNCQ